jgi:hypothetical protein
MGNALAAPHAAILAGQFALRQSKVTFFGILKNHRL